MSNLTSQDLEETRHWSFLLTRLGKFVETRIGLHFPPERLDDLERGIRSAAGEFGFKTTESCIEWLLSSTLSHSQIETLAGHLIVGETYFFRDKRVFELLETQVLRKIIDSRRGQEQNLRIWSAACSTGEEPYSLAILLARILPDLKDWNITILATDISPPSLKKAATGVYGEWSFRDTPRWVKDGYFKSIEKKSAIDCSVQRMVRFSYLNLAEDIYPAIINGTNAMDIIFCRNVLMYFSRARATAVIHNLSRCLVEGGWLVVSPVDTPGTEMPPSLHSVRFPGAMFYQKGPIPVVNIPRPVTTQAIPRAEKKTATATKSKKITQTAYAKRSAKLLPVVDQNPRDIGKMSNQARQLADQGKLANALALCQEAIEYDKLNPALHYLQATILQEMGKEVEATVSLQRALYINQEFAIGHFALGHLLHAQGKRKEAGKHLEKARSLLKKYDQKDVPPEAEGISAGRLIELVNMMLDIEGRE